jgi:hypothetical protein
LALGTEIPVQLPGETTKQGRGQDAVVGSEDRAVVIVHDLVSTGTTLFIAFFAKMKLSACAGPNEGHTVAG